MKPLQIAALVVAGALGGAIVMKTVQRSATEVAQAPVQAPVQTPAEQPQTAPVPQPQPPVEAPAPIRLPSVSAPPPAPVATSAAPEPVKQEKKPAAQQHAAVRHPIPAPDLPIVVKVQSPPSAEIPVPPAQPDPQTAPEPRPAPPAAPAPRPASPARAESENVTPPPEPPPAPRKVTLNAGMLIPVRFVDGLSSERNAPGDVFTGTLTKDLAADGLIFADRGARVEGRVVSADRGGRVRGVASLAVELTRIHTNDGQNVAIETDAFERHSEPGHGQDAAKVGGGAAVGAIIGALAGGGKGAAVGAGVGGAAGAGDVLLTRGRPATLPSETRVSFRLKTAVTLTENIR